MVELSFAAVWTGDNNGLCQCIALALVYVIIVFLRVLCVLVSLSRM